MKLTALAFILLLTSSIYTVNGQEQPKQLDEATKLKIQKLRELEAQLNSLPASAKVKAKGDDSSITIEWKATVTETASNKDNKSMTQTKRFEINLSELDVPNEYIEEIVKERPLQDDTKCGELPGVILRQIGITPKYRLEEDYEYPGDGYTIRVVRPFVYDRASIPPIFWVLRLDKDSVGNVAPLIHDLLYQNGGVLPQNQVSPYRNFSKEDADKIFRDALRRCGVPRWKYEAAYVAVSVAGKKSFKKPPVSN